MIDLSIKNVTPQEIGRKFGLLQDFLKNNLVGQTVDATSPTTAAQTFAVQHTLGIVPMFVIGADETGAQNLGYTDSEKKLWTKTAVYVHSGTASTKYRILIVGAR